MGEACVPDGALRLPTLENVNFPGSRAGKRSAPAATKGSHRKA